MSVVVIGNSWGALGSLAYWSEKKPDEKLIWLQGNQTNAAHPLFSLPLEEKETLVAWEKFFSRLKLPWDEPKEGKIIGYRSKKFFEMKDLDPEGFWKPEQILIGDRYAHFGRNLSSIKEEAKITLEASPIEIRKDIPIRSITPGSLETTVTLGSGESFQTDHLIYADSWGLLSEIEGLPRPLSFLRKREPSGLLQVSFTHQSLGEIEKDQDYCISLNREDKKELPRHGFGYFKENKSIWSVCLSSSELEDNHEITKRLRKLKNALEKAFPLLEFQEDAVKFHEEFSVAGLEKPQSLGHIVFLSDGLGPHVSLNQLESLNR